MAHVRLLSPVDPRKNLAREPEDIFDITVCDFASDRDGMEGWKAWSAGVAAGRQLMRQEDPPNWSGGPVEER